MHVCPRSFAKEANAGRAKAQILLAETRNGSGREPVTLFKYVDS